MLWLNKFVTKMQQKAVFLYFSGSSYTNNTQHKVEEKTHKIDAAKRLWKI